MKITKWLARIKLGSAAFLGLCLITFDAVSLDLSDQRLVFNSEDSSAEYRLTLSAVKSVNATVVADREMLVSGRLSRHTYEFLNSIKYDEAWAMLSRAAKFDAFRELYSCDGLSCGRSNVWANNRFGIKQLYGLDQLQKYRVFERSDEFTTEFLVVYFIQRGNKRIYAQVDRIFTEKPLARIAESSSTITRLIETNGYYIIERNDQSEFSQQQLELLVQALRKKPISTFYVVGHCANSASADKNLECAQQAATDLSAELIKMGVAKHRLEPASVGSFAPRTGVSSNRVELVAQGVRP